MGNQINSCSCKYLYNESHEEVYSKEDKTKPTVQNNHTNARKIPRQEEEDSVVPRLGNPKEKANSMMMANSRYKEKEIRN